MEGTRMRVVALDAMGGDNGADAAVRGASALSLEATDVHVLAVGDIEQMSKILDDVEYSPKRLTLVRADGVVPMAADPRAALDQRPRCSILVASQLVASGEATALVSAGHTGATILASARVFQRLPGVQRAALAAVHPTEARHGPHGDPFGLMLDVGATLSATPEDLVAFAVMGAAYSSIVSEVASPRVALLSNGTERGKGTPAIIEAHRRLLVGPLNFIGNIEGLDIPRGTADVVVCDGFLGNVVLKMLEGVGEVVRDVAREASSRKLKWRVGLSMLSGGIQELKRLTDWKAYGGAPLLGFDQVVIKAHGRSEARAIRNAIKVAAKSANGDLIGRIRDGASAAGLGDT